jgi:two-component system, LytTR family, sensor kinase
MIRKVSTYWMCQIGGWTMNFAIFTFFYLTLSIRHIDHFFVIITINVVLGILFSHLMRIVIKEYQFLKQPIQKQIIYFTCTTILFSILYACTDVAIEKIFDLSQKDTPEISLVNEITRTSINNFFYLFIWNLIYFIYH